MLLAFANSEPFAIGVTDYLYQPTSKETDNRIFLQIEIEDVLATAVLDTGSPFVICAPDVAKRIGVQQDPQRGTQRILIRGLWREGQLHRLRLTFVATEGQSLDVQATVFIPNVTEEESWGDLPSFIGLSACLERIRFAVDPGEDRFYFGPIVNDFL